MTMTPDPSNANGGVVELDGIELPPVEHYMPVNGSRAYPEQVRAYGYACAKAALTAIRAAPPSPGAGLSEAEVARIFRLVENLADIAGKCAIDHVTAGNSNNRKAEYNDACEAILDALRRLDATNAEAVKFSGEVVEADSDAEGRCLITLRGSVEELGPAAKLLFQNATFTATLSDPPK